LATENAEFSTTTCWRQLTIVKKEEWSDKPVNELEEKAAAFQSGYQQLTEKYTKIEDYRRLRSQ
jgi:ADP-dependent phosphofructokinase/glucokinase